MASAFDDEKYREELSAIEQCMFLSLFCHSANPILYLYVGFEVLTEAERTASVYTLLQSSSQGQIQFFIAVLQQMIKYDNDNGEIIPVLLFAFLGVQRTLR